MKEMISDKELIKGCISGNPKYQEMLYHRFATAMLGVCRRYTRNTAEAEDMLQEVFVKVFLHLKDFRQESSLGYWIKRLAINALISEQRKKNVSNYTVSMEESVQEFSAVTVPVDTSIPMDVLLQMVDELPEGYKTVFNLREIDGYELQEIADMLNCTNATVRSQLFKAKKKLKERIEKWMAREI